MFNPAMLTLAREAAGLTQTSLAHQSGISQAQISKIEARLYDPPADLQSSFAEACAVPVEFFSQPEQVIGEGIIEFFHRRRRTLPAKPLTKAHASANIVRLEVDRLLRHIELADTAPFPTVPEGEGMSPEDSAALARAAWRLPAGPLPDLVALVEACGIPVVQMSLGHEKLRALSMPGPYGRHIIVLNSDLSASNQRFSLAHEIGHLAMHYGSVSPTVEEEADAYASALLVPAQDVRRDLQSVRFRDLGPLKQKWHVSMQVLIRAAKDTNCISERQARTFYIEMNKLPGKRKHEPGEFPAERSRLVRRVLEHYRDELGYSVKELAGLMIASEERVRTFYFEQPPQARTLHAIGRPVGIVQASDGGVQGA